MESEGHKRPLGLDPIRQIEGEILQEMADALSRTGKRIEDCLSRLQALQEEIRRATQRGDRGRVPLLMEEFRNVRALALKYLYYLTVQREAIGFRIHPDFKEIYPIPPSVGPTHGSGEDNNP